MIKVFISGKMTGEPNYNREKFFEVEQELKQEDLFIVLNPAILPDGLKHEEYMKICLAMIDACDMVIMLEGWENSKGATMERDYAIANNKAVNEWKEWYELMNILAIDPGNTQSAFVVINEETYKPLDFGKIENTELLKMLRKTRTGGSVIEMVACYGMAVGKEVFDTCVWIGRFDEAIGGDSILVYRKDVKMNLCGTTKAKDGNIIQALKDRFGDKGTKANPGWFYGFKADCWQAYALGVTYLDKMKGEPK